MKKKNYVFLLFCLLLLGGCNASSLLKEVPRDFSVTGPGPVGEQGSGGQRNIENIRCPETGQSSASAPGSDAAQGGKDAAQGGKDVAQGEQDAARKESFLYDGAFEYSAGTLSEAELTWYEDIKRTLGSFGEKERLDAAALAAGCDEEDIDRIFQCVLNDHPELFYVEGYSYTRYTRGDKITAIAFSGTYSIDRETAEGRRKEIEAAAEKILSGADEEADQYAKVKYVYDTIIRETDYDPASPDNQNVYSVFVNNRSVCQGYAKAIQYLLNRLGVECTLVLGTVESGEGQEGHAWNLVKVDGEYYYVDATWGDASYTQQDGEAENAGIPEINYDYLNVTTEELLKTHTLGENIPMPQCAATEANYYFREGALFTSYDREQMKGLFDRAEEQGRDDVTVKCADWECYTEVLTELVDNHEIFRYLGESGATVAYAKNDNQMSLTFWVTNE